MTDTLPPGTPMPSDDDVPSPDSTEIQEPGWLDRLGQSSILRLSILLVALAYAAIVNVWLFVLIMALVISIFLHELGHFLVAKRNGMQVTEFFLGFGPRIWSFRRGETEYGLKVIPAGAYVKIIGMSNLEEVAPADEARSYRAKSFGKRMPVVLAGPMVNIALGLVLMFGVFATFGYPEAGRQISGVSSGSAAAAAGLQQGDEILAIGGDTVEDFDGLSALVRANSGSTVDLTVLRDGTETVIPATIGWGLTEDSATALGLDAGDRVTQVDGAAVATYPELVAAMARADGPVGLEVAARTGTETVLVSGPVSLPEDGQKGFLGVGPKSVLSRGNAVEAGGQAATEFGTVITKSIEGMGRLFSPSGISNLYHLVVNANDDDQTMVVQESAPGTSEAPAQQSNSSSNSTVDENRPSSILGIISIGTQVGDVAGWAGVLLLLATVNIFLGLINLVPLLPFDGGHIAVSIYEEIRSRIAHRQYRVDMAKLLPVTYVVLVLMVGLFLSTLYLDVADPVSIK